MGVKRRFFWFTLAFIGTLLLFLAYIPQNAGVLAQEYEPRSVEDRINSSPSINLEIKPEDGSGSLTPGAVAAGDNPQITIYEQGIALVKERREISLESGINQVEYSNIASGIDPASVIIEDPENRDTVILEQNYEYDLVNSSSLLAKYLARRSIVTRQKR